MYHLLWDLGDFTSLKSPASELLEGYPSTKVTFNLSYFLHSHSSVGIFTEIFQTGCCFGLAKGLSLAAEVAVLKSEMCDHCLSIWLFFREGLVKVGCSSVLIMVRQHPLFSWTSMLRLVGRVSITISLHIRVGNLHHCLSQFFCLSFFGPRWNSSESAQATSLK